MEFDCTGTPGSESAFGSTAMPAGKRFALSISAFRETGRFRVDSPRHPDSVEIFWIRSGVGRIESEGCGPIRSGDLILQPGGGADIEASRPLSGYLLTIPMGWLKEMAADSFFSPVNAFLDEICSAPVRVRLDAEAHASAEWLLRQMLVKDEAAPEIAAISLRLTFRLFLTVCYGQWKGHRNFARTVSATGEDVVSAVVDYIDQHITEDLDLVQLARRAGYSQSYFSTLFAKATGQNVTEYICRSRIERACRLLASTNDKVMQICYDAGFRDLAHFNRTFKKFVGITPSQYREQALAASRHPVTVSHVGAAF